MKKAISMLLSFVMLLSITAGLDLSAYADIGENYEYNILGGNTAEIKHYYGNETELVIPSLTDIQ